MRKLLYTITPLFCAIILFTGCTKNKNNDITTSTGGPAVTGTRVTKSFNFTSAYIDYNISYRYGSSDNERYTSLMYFTGDHEYKYYSLNVDLQSRSTSPSLKMEIDVYMPDMFTNFSSSYTLKMNGIVYDASWSNIAIVDIDETKNRMTILFTLQSRYSTVVYTGQLTLQ